MQTYKGGLIPFLRSSLDWFRLSIKTWIRQEVVDDDPYDVDTLFPQDSQQNRSDQTRERD